MVIAYETKKLDDFQSSWLTHEKFFLSLLHCLKMLQYHLELHFRKVYKDELSLRYFETQMHVSALAHLTPHCFIHLALQPATEGYNLHVTPPVFGFLANSEFAHNVGSAFVIPALCYA